MPVVADVDADFGEAKVENRIPQIPRTKIEFLPEPRRNMRNVCFAVFPEVRTVALNYSCCVVINAFALNFVDWNDERNPQFRCEFAQELDGRSVRNALGEIVPTNRLLGAKVRTIENFLQANDFRACLGSLSDHSHVLINHRLLDFFERTLGRFQVSCLDQRTAYDSRHGCSRDAYEWLMLPFSGGPRQTY